MISLLTVIFYILPVYACAKRNFFSAATIFFVYTFLGWWTLGMFLEADLADSSILVVPGLLNFDVIPWLTLASINFLIFIIYISFSKKRRKIWVEVAQSAPVRSTKYLTKILVIAGASIVLEFFLAIYLYGGFVSWVTATFSRTVIENSAINLLFPLILAVNTYLLIIGYLLKTNNPRRQAKILFTLLILAQSAFLLFSGGRSVLLLFLISLYVINFRKIKASTLIKLGVGAVLAIAFSGYMISERYKAQGAVAQFDTNAKNIIAAAYTGLPFADHIALSQIYAESVGHDYGQSYLNALMSFVPRAIWNTKPVQLSRKMREQFFGDIDGGIPPGIFGEGLIAFGYMGLFGIAILYAFILVKVENYCRRPSRIHAVRLRLAAISTLFGFVLVRGGVDIGIYRVGIILFLYFVLEKILLKKYEVR